MRISKATLLEKAKNYEELLKDQGFNVNIRPHFAYGAYSFYFNFNPVNVEVTRKDGYTDQMRQVQTKMGTKREVWEDLARVYWMVLARHEVYKWEHTE